jgi:hypothetical protein
MKRTYTWRLTTSRLIMGAGLLTSIWQGWTVMATILAIVLTGYMKREE